MIGLAALAMSAVVLVYGFVFGPWTALLILVIAVLLALIILGVMS